MDMTVYAQLQTWLDNHFDELKEDIKALAAIPSVSEYGDMPAPFGEGCRQALEAMLRLAERYGFETRNYENRYGCMTRRPASEEISFWGHLDVVPAGEGWQVTQPFVPVERDGWLIGRGTDDNKGPTLGVLYMLRAFEELNIPTRHGLRLFVGCDEEHGMRDVEHYAANYPPQKLTIIADCGFPVCYGEKGIIEADIVTDAPLTCVAAMQAGMASNIVPDTAEMTLKGLAVAACESEWTTAEAQDGNTRILARGLSRHSAFPEGGVNAIHQMMRAALSSGLLDEQDARAMGFFVRVNDDYLGTALGIDGQDDISGYTTCTGTMCSLRPDGRGVLHLNIRYCISADSDAMLRSMEEACRAHGCTLETARVSKPNYFPKESPVVSAMTDAYNALTGEHAKPYVMGGGTYARKLQHALGFGLGGLPRPECALFAQGHGGAHQPDEGLYLANFKRAILLFAMAVLEADRVL